MKIIDLLNKIANGEEVPNKIKYNDRIYEYTKEIDWYLREDLKSELFIDKNRLNDEVEILEEEKKIPEKLGEIDDNDGYIDQYDVIKIGKKVDEIIDYLKSKGE